MQCKLGFISNALLMVLLLLHTGMMICLNVQTPVVQMHNTDYCLIDGFFVLFHSFNSRYLNTHTEAKYMVL